MGAWFTLSTSYDIGTVRSVLTFLLSLVSAAGTWIVSFAYWKAGATRALRSTSGTELLSLFSMEGVGDAVEALGVIHKEMSRSLLLRLVLQAAAVVYLVLLGVLSPPMAQWSTRTGMQVGVRPVPGWLAWAGVSNTMDGALVLWNATIERLKAAKFPLDRLPDFLPDNDVPWLFREEEWQNTTWFARCTWTSLTPVYGVVCTGNHSGWPLDELPALRDAVDPDPLFHGPQVSYVSGFRLVLGGDHFKDVLLILGAQTDPESIFIDPSNALPLVDPATGNPVVNTVAYRAPLSLRLAAMHLRDAPTPHNSSLWFGTGTVGSAALTRADCHLTRAMLPVDRDGDGKRDHDDWSAYPWTIAPDRVISVLVNFYTAALASASYTDREFPHPSGEELFRFYQAYTITRDTQYHIAPADGRRLTMLLPSVEVSVAAVVMFGTIVATLAAVAVWSLLLGQCGGGGAELEKAKAPGMWVPRTKMGWIMEGVREASKRTPGRTSAVEDEEAERWMRRKLKAELATASYGWTAAPSEVVGSPVVLG